MEFESYIDTIDCSKDNADHKISSICERTMKDLLINWANYLVLICGECEDNIRAKSCGMKGDITQKTYLYHIMRWLISFKKKQLKKYSRFKYEFYFCCYEVMTICDNSHIQCDEEINDLVSLGSSNISLTESANETAKTESDMQEICIDSNSLEELVMVIEDIITKRKMYCSSYIKDNLMNLKTMSHLITKIRTTRIDQNSTETSECELVIFDICELNEPLENIQRMFESLESNENSLSLDTRICQLIFEKLRKCNRFNLIAFMSNNQNAIKTEVDARTHKRLQIKIHSYENTTDDSEDKVGYFIKLKRFIKVVERVVKNSYELFQNFHSRLLENISSEEGNNESSLGAVDFIKGVFSSFTGNQNKVNSIKTTRTVAEMNRNSISLQTQISKRKCRRVHLSLNENQSLAKSDRSANQIPKKEINLHDICIEDNYKHHDLVINKVKSNILKELNIQNMQNKGNRSLCAKQQTQFNKADRTSFSPIHKANISKESSFASNIFNINSKHRVIDLNKYNSKDLDNDKENIRNNKRFERISEESKNHAISRNSKILIETERKHSKILDRNQLCTKCRFLNYQCICEKADLKLIKSKNYINSSIGSSYKSPENQNKNCKHFSNKIQKRPPPTKLCLCNKSICSSIRPEQKDLGDQSDNYSITESEIDLSMPQHNEVQIKMIECNNPRVKPYLVTEEREKRFDSYGREMYLKPPQNSTISKYDESESNENEINYENLKLIQESMKCVSFQMNNFLQYFADKEVKAHSKKRSFLGNLCQSLSCSGRSDKDKRRGRTPTTRQLEFNFKNISKEINESENSQTRMKSYKNSKLATKIATRRHINLFSKERKLKIEESDKILTTATHRREHKSSKGLKPLEVSTKKKYMIHSDKDTYSLGLSTQHYRPLFRTLDDVRE